MKTQSVSHQMRLITFKLIIISFASIGFLFMSGCAGRQPLQSYSRMEIERPYTLPEGITTWSTITFFSYAKDTSGSSTLPPIPVPLF